MSIDALHTLEAADSSAPEGPTVFSMLSIYGWCV